MTGIDAQPRAAGTIAIRNVTVDDVRRLWPTDIAPHARAWLVENDIAGRLVAAQRTA